MASIRFPKNGLSLMTLCKANNPEGIFATYADLVAFAAAFGCYLVKRLGHRPRNKTTFADSPNPIDLQIFESRGHYPNLLMIALAHEESRSHAEDVDLLAKLIEWYAGIGFETLTPELSGKTPPEQIDRICELLQEAANPDMI